MIQFCAKVQKPYFCPFLGPFCPKSREREFSQIWDLRRKLANHKTLHFRPFLAKTNDSIFRKNPKTLFLGLFGRLLLPNFAPIFRGEGVELVKKLSISIWKYISTAIQIWNQIFKIFSSCVGYWHLKNVTKNAICLFLDKWEFFWKMVFGAVYTL